MTKRCGRRSSCSGRPVTGSAASGSRPLSRCSSAPWSSTATGRSTRPSSSNWLRISAATIDRLLSTTREQASDGRKRRSGVGSARRAQCGPPAPSAIGRIPRPATSRPTWWSIADILSRAVECLEGWRGPAHAPEERWRAPWVAHPRGSLRARLAHGATVAGSRAGRLGQGADGALGGDVPRPIHEQSAASYASRVASRPGVPSGRKRSSLGISHPPRRTKSPARRLRLAKPSALEPFRLGMMVPKHPWVVPVAMKLIAPHGERGQCFVIDPACDGSILFHLGQWEEAGLNHQHRSNVCARQTPPLCRHGRGRRLPRPRPCPSVSPLRRVRGCFAGLRPPLTRLRGRLPWA